MNYQTKSCYQFLRTGSCKYGERCKFLHVNPTQIKCKYYTAYGQCDFGNKCKYSHISERSCAPSSQSTSIIRNNRKQSLCRYYYKNKFKCKDCKYLHKKYEGFNIRFYCGHFKVVTSSIGGGCNCEFSFIRNQQAVMQAHQNYIYTCLNHHIWINKLWK